MSKLLSVMGLILLAGGLCSPLSAASYGEPLPQGPGLGLSEVMAKTDLDQPQLISGRITDVCQNKGCWAVLEHQGKSARLMMHDHAFFLPKDYRGAARVYGRLSRIELSADEAKHMAEESTQAGADAEATAEYRVDALGVELLEEEAGHGD